jgi:hypothetical protein
LFRPAVRQLGYRGLKFLEALDKKKAHLKRMLWSVLRPSPSPNAQYTIIAIIMAVIIPSSAYQILADIFGFGGLKINIDFLIILCAIVVTFRLRLKYTLPIAFIAITISFSVLMLFGFGAIYISDLVALGQFMTFASYWPWHLIVTWLLLIFGLLIGLYLVKRRIDFARVYLTPLLAAIAILVTVGTRDTFNRLTGRNWLTSGWFNLYRIARESANYTVSLEVPFPSRTMFSDLSGTDPPRRILSIGIESLGVLQDGESQQRIVAQLAKEVSPRYQLAIGIHSYLGSTLSGEIRELCGLQVTGVPDTSAAGQLGKACLPAQLERLGYATIGIHGNVRQFYNRMRIYPMFGFSRTMFLDDFERQRSTMELCNGEAFSGVCDSAAVSAALGFISAHPTAFAHVMTLQTHLPMAASDLGSSDCSRFPHLEQSDLCLYANQQAETLRRIGVLLMASPTPPDVVYLYGDHAPPFALRSLREKFVRGQVPYIVLTRR